MPPNLITRAEMDARMDAEVDTFALDIPPDFQRDVLARRGPTIQLNVDATRMTQAFAGSGYIQAIVMTEVNGYAMGHRMTAMSSPVSLNLHARFNHELNRAWFGSLMEIINQVTLLSIVLAGAALIREREHGTVEHLLVMPVTPFEIMMSKVWAMGLVGAWWGPPPPCWSWFSGCSRCRSRVRSCCSLTAAPWSCSPPPRWEFSLAPWPAPCRNSACC